MSAGFNNQKCTMIPVIQTGFGEGKNKTQLASYSSFGIPPQAYQEATGANF